MELYKTVQHSDCTEPCCKWSGKFDGMGSCGWPQVQQRRCTTQGTIKSFEVCMVANGKYQLELVAMRHKIKCYEMDI